MNPSTKSAEPASTRSATIMYGKPVAEAIEARLKAEVPEFIARHKLAPTLAIVQVGSDPASERYIRRKMEACARLGMRAELRQFAESIAADDLRQEVRRLSRAAEFHGVLVQLPLPRHIEEPQAGATGKFDIFDAIADEKDVDGVGRKAIAELYRAQQDRMRFLPGTALAVRRMLSFYGVETKGKKAVVVGRNDITAKPILLMLGGRMGNAAAIWVHRHVAPEAQERLIREADIVVTAVGSPHYRITAEMLKAGAVVVDVATRVTESGKLTGDVDFEAAKEVAGYITPVPGGVGPVTVAALTENLFRAAQFAAGVGEVGYRF